MDNSGMSIFTERGALDAAIAALQTRVKERDAEIERLRAALRSCEAWIDRWTKHVGQCEGGNKCTCGRTAVLYEAGAALTDEQNASPNNSQAENQ